MENVNISEEFSTILTKFMFINCNEIGVINNKEELNFLLNDLNGFDFKTCHISENSVLRLINSLVNIPTNEDTLIVKTCCLIVSICSTRSISIPTIKLKQTLKWLIKCLQYNFDIIICNVLAAVQCLIRGAKLEHISEFLDYFLSPDDGLLLRLLKDPNCTTSRQGSFRNSYEINQPEEIQLSSILCLETFLSLLLDQKTCKGSSSSIDESNPSALILSTENLNSIGNILINLAYKTNIRNLIEPSYCKFMTANLYAFRSLCLLNSEWKLDNFGHLLGISKAFILYGVPNVQQILPEKIVTSQQVTLEPVLDQPLNKGGKVQKTRKPQVPGKKNRKKRATNKQKQESTEISNIDQIKLENRNFSFETNLFNDFDSFNTSWIRMRTSDSDVSGSESNRFNRDRQKQSQVRFAALSLTGILVKDTNRKILFGYWHSIFPQEELAPTAVSLLNCLLRDPNKKCRISAIQAISLILYGSKLFLVQAENCEKPPTTFMPFSIALGNMIVTIYSVITRALSTESSLQVLNDLLKCLTVLIQVTPFHRLQPGFVTKFIVYIKQLINHADPTIQVAALTVMEFLLSSHEITNEISECIGVQNYLMANNKKLPTEIHNFGGNEIISDDEEEILVEDDGIGESNKNSIDEPHNSVSDIKNDKPLDGSSINMSWLLQKVLENLGVYMSPSNNSVSSTHQLRLESLQLLSTMGSHFLLLKKHLLLVSKALNNGFIDTSVEIRITAAKSLDTIGHSINNYLLTSSNAGSNSDDLNLCLNFWLHMIPIVSVQIQDENQNLLLKAICCDCYSNIGVHVFERLPRDRQIHLISILSGCSYDENSIISASAVRSLAIYVLFPTLHDDLCFIENTIEAILKLLNSPSTVPLAKIKGSWALSTICDSFISSNITDKLISDELLRRLFETSLKITTEIEKIRYNAVRTLGILLRLITEEQLKCEFWHSLCLTSIKSLVTSISISSAAMKSKWNSCYAIGNFMKNSNLFFDLKIFNWLDIVFPSLCNLIVNSSNFKVRINGACALAVPVKKEYYGKYFITIWTSLLSAMEQSDHLEDLNEYKHRDNLLEQLSYSISHLLNLSTINDLVPFANELHQFLDITKQIWIRVINRVVSEKANSMINACAKLKQFQMEHLSVEQKSALQLLQSCFVEMIEYV